MIRCEHGTSSFSYWRGTVSRIQKLCNGFLSLSCAWLDESILFFAGDTSRLFVTYLRGRDKVAHLFDASSDTRQVLFSGQATLLSIRCLTSIINPLTRAFRFLLGGVRWSRSCSASDHFERVSEPRNCLVFASNRFDGSSNVCKSLIAC